MLGQSSWNSLTGCPNILSIWSLCSEVDKHYHISAGATTWSNVQYRRRANWIYIYRHRLQSTILKQTSGQTSWGSEEGRHNVDHVTYRGLIGYKTMVATSICPIRLTWKGSLPVYRHLHIVLIQYSLFDWMLIPYIGDWWMPKVVAPSGNSPLFPSVPLLGIKVSP